MSQEFILGDGRIFKQTDKGTYVERKHGGWNGVEVNEAQIKQYEEYTGVPRKSLKDSSHSDPRFTNMMWDKSSK